MVASLLSAGAKANLVTDPNPENPGGCTAADLASKNGHEGLAAYLAEKGLVQHFKDMSIAGNISGSLPTSDDTSTVPNENNNLTEDEIFLNDTLAAYRTAADAAARIQSAFRERSLKIRTKQIHFLNPEDEARNIIAAMRIQHAFRNYELKKQMTAAARIQHRFRTWKLRRDFLNMRRQVIKIQVINSRSLSLSETGSVLDLSLDPLPQTFLVWIGNTTSYSCSSFIERNRVKRFPFSWS